MKIVIAAAAVGLCAGPVACYAQAEQVSVAFAAQSEVPKPARTTWLVLKMTPKLGWHGYWRNPGESGGETKLIWTAPPGVTFGEVLWGAPIVQKSFGLTSYVMDGDYSLLVPMRLPSDIPLGKKFEVAVSVAMFVCTEGMCSSQKVRGSIDLVAGDGAPSQTGATLVSEARRRLPMKAAAIATVSEAGTSLAVAGVRLNTRSTKVFIADRKAPISVGNGGGRSTARGTTFDLAWKPAGPFEGIITDGARSWSFRATLAQAAAAAAYEAEVGPKGQVAPVRAPTEAAESLAGDGEQEKRDERSDGDTSDQWLESAIPAILAGLSLVLLLAGAFWAATTPKGRRH